MSADGQTFSGVRCQLCGVVRMNAMEAVNGVVRCQDRYICDQVVMLVKDARSTYDDLIEAGWKPVQTRTYMVPPADRDEGCDCTELCSMGPTCPGGILAGLPGSGCHRVSSPAEHECSDYPDPCSHEPAHVPWTYVLPPADSCRWDECPKPEECSSLGCPWTRVTSPAKTIPVSDSTPEAGMPP